MWKKTALLFVVVTLVVATSFAPAWWVKGHETITEAAVTALPADVPGFFRAGAKCIAHCAGDPDRWKNRNAHYLKDAEAPNHFLDMEDLEGNAPPTTRFQAIALLQKLNHPPDKAGLLPWAIAEGFDRLTCAFYDYRQDPANPAIAMKALVYAGNMAHYTTDAAMPLHTTRDYDGKRQPDGNILQKGIHAKLDAFPELNGFTPEDICRGLQAQAIEGDVFEYIVAFIRESHRQIEEAYRLDAAGAIAKPTDESRKFVMARCRAGAQFTMDIWYTAWLRSEKMPAHY